LSKVSILLREIQITLPLSYIGASLDTLETTKMATSGKPLADDLRRRLLQESERNVPQREIAKQLGISKTTVNKHAKSDRKK